MKPLAAGYAALWQAAESIDIPLFSRLDCHPVKQKQEKPIVISRLGTHIRLPGGSHPPAACGPLHISIESEKTLVRQASCR